MNGTAEHVYQAEAFLVPGRNGKGKVHLARMDPDGTFPTLCGLFSDVTDGSIHVLEAVFDSMTASACGRCARVVNQRRAS